VRVDNTLEGRRIDSALTEMLEISRNQIQRFILEGFIKVNGLPVKKNYRLRPDDTIDVEFPPPSEVAIEAVDAPIEIVYMDEDVVVVDKPAGLVVHPGAGRERTSVLSALKFRGITLSEIGAPLRGGVVHRIDKDTSGLIVLARNAHAHFILAKQFFSHTIERKYLGVVHGHLEKKEGVVDAAIGRHPVRRKEFCVRENAKEARTAYRVLRRLADYDVVEFRLYTGRTHQIRVHMRHLGHPLVGDVLYAKGRKDPIDRQALHAFLLGFIHPATGKNVRFYSSLPDDIRRLIRNGG